VSSRAGEKVCCSRQAVSINDGVIKGRPPRLPEIFQSYGAPLFFVTICTLHRRSIPSLEAAHNALLLYGTRATKEFNVALGRYVIMPDHLHLFVRGDQSFVLATWVKGLKRAISKGLPAKSQASFWQPGFFDHLLRSDESYAQKWEYVRQNPVRAGLIQFADDWPYQGEVVQIDRA
jgi:putative transposase